jgi:hypothetical protein
VGVVWIRGVRPGGVRCGCVWSVDHLYHSGTV